jgi:hypothetical protein
MCVVPSGSPLEAPLMPVGLRLRHARPSTSIHH